MRFLEIVLTSLLLGAPSLGQSVHVVDQLNGPRTDFTTIQASTQHWFQQDSTAVPVTRSL